MRRIVAAIALALAPFPVFADALNGPIVPNCSGVGAANDVACNFCDLIHLFNNGLNFAVAFTVVVATIMFVYAGYLYFSASSNPEHIKKAHGIFSKVFIGLVIVIAAWLIIDVVMKTLVGNSQLGPWNEIQCSGIASPSGTIAPSQQPGSGTTVTPTTTTLPGGTLTDAEARRRLAAAGIQVTSSGNCNNPNIRTCTSLDGIPASTVQHLIDIKEHGCGGGGCAVTVTGGTETGHLSHGPGLPVVDIAYDPATAAYIHDNAAALGITSICTMPVNAQYRYNCSYNESQPHLHIGF